MSSSAGPVVPPGQSPPFAVVTPTDHTAWIIIATAFSLACLLFFCFIRISVRLTIRNGFGADDYVLFASTILATIQSSIVLGACSKGLGKAVDLVPPGAQNRVQEMYYTSNFFFLMAIGLSKISVVCFLHRLTSTRKHRRIFNAVIGVIAVWIVGSVLAIALQCDLGHPWISVHRHCPGIRVRWDVIGAFDIVLEVAIMSLVGFLVSGLQTALSNKTSVMAIFSARLFIIIFVAFRLHTFDQAGYTTNPFLREARFIAWTQAEMTYSLISATVPTFQQFLRNLSTGFGGIGSAEGRSGYAFGYGSGGGGGSRSHDRRDNSMNYQLSHMGSANKSVIDGDDESSDDNNNNNNNKKLDRDHYHHSSAHALTTNPNIVHRVYAGPGSTAMVHSSGGEAANNGETISINSDESRSMMIRKEVQWTVGSEDRR